MWLLVAGRISIALLSCAGSLKRLTEGKYVAPPKVFYRYVSLVVVLPVNDGGQSTKLQLPLLKPAVCHCQGSNLGTGSTDI